MIYRPSPDQVFHFFIHFVFWCSVASMFLAGLERSLHKFYPGTRADRVVSFLNDLVTQWGALNLRDKIAGPPAEDRRGGG